MRRWAYRAAFTSCFVLLAFVSVFAFGQRIAEAQPAVAAKLMVEGDRATAAGKHEEALAAYQKAHAANASGATAVRIANALYKLNRLGEAYDAYEAALKQTLLGGDKKTANDRIAEIGGKTGTIAVTVSEAGATVSIDGKAAGTSPLAKPLRVMPGSHKLSVTKDGFTPFESTVDVAAKGAVTADAKLKEVEKGAKVSVTIKGGEAMQVLVDGAEVGPSPWEGTLGAGPHKISARSPKSVAAEVTVEVKAGVPQAVELVPGEGRGTLEVRTEMPKSKISVDGKEVGTGTFNGELPAGEHEVSVALDGYATATKKVTVLAGEVVAETITLRKATAGAVVEKTEAPWSFNGLYGGFQLVGMFEPTGSGNTLEDGCEVTGATSCESGNPMGGGIAGYIGYAFAPVGLELFLLGGGDLVEPSATFDGVTGSEINPLVAAPAREESFIIGRFGGGGAARIRVLVPVDRFRITGAVGAGLAYRHMLLGRD
ncbi:MAG: PEGA domain-containing protein, partial [Myxococcales bacterium]|nr:PEGA domain-containing protein [Myxococcales bacterium]